MSLAQWIIFKDGQTTVDGLVYSDIFTPLEGISSVVFSHTPSITFQSMSLYPSFHPTGFLAGRIQTRIRLDSFDDGGSPSLVENHVGLLCMQSVTNIAQFGGGEAYAFSLSIGEGFSTQSVRLWKFSQGIDGTLGQLNVSEILVSNLPPFTLVQGGIYSIELAWRADPFTVSTIGGALLNGRIGLLADFSDLQTIVEFVDTTLPLTNTVGEGLWAGLRNTNSTIPHRVTCDKTSLYRLTFP
jgi:hypothetical protein